MLPLSCVTLLPLSDRLAPSWPGSGTVAVSFVGAWMTTAPDALIATSILEVVVEETAWSALVALVISGVDSVRLPPTLRLAGVGVLSLPDVVAPSPLSRIALAALKVTLENWSILMAPEPSEMVCALIARLLVPRLPRVGSAVPPGRLSRLTVCALMVTPDEFCVSA